MSLAPDLFDHRVLDGDAVSAPHLQKAWVDFLGVKALFCIKISALSSLSAVCHSKAVQQVENGLRVVTLFLALRMNVASLQKHSRYAGPDRSSGRDGLAHFKGSLWYFCRSTGLGQLMEGARQACPGCFLCLVHPILTKNSVFSLVSSKVPWPGLWQLVTSYPLYS